MPDLLSYDHNSNFYKLGAILDKARNNEGHYKEIIDEIKTVLKDDINGDCYKIFQHSPYGNPPGNNLLLCAIARDVNSQIVKLLIDDAKTKLSEQDFKECLSYQYSDLGHLKPGESEKTYLINTPLTLCLKYGKYDLAIKLLQEGADPNGKDRHYFTPLAIACIHVGLANHEKNSEIFEVIKLLAEKGADATHIDQAGLTPLEYLTKDLDRNKMVVYTLQEKRATISSELVATIEQLDQQLREEMTRSLLEQGIDVEKRIKDKQLIDEHIRDKKMLIEEFGFPAFGTKADLINVISHSLTRQKLQAKKRIDEEEVTQEANQILLECYEQACGNSFYLEGKIMDSLTHGDKIISDRIREYGRREDKVTTKQDFFASQEGRQLKTAIFELYESQLQQLVPGEEKPITWVERIKQRKDLKEQHAYRYKIVNETAGQKSTQSR